jgi:hypothetical protein
MAEHKRNPIVPRQTSSRGLAGWSHLTARPTLRHGVLIVALASIATVGMVSRSSVPRAEALASSASSRAPGVVTKNMQHSRPRIEGAKNPEAVSDATAYMFFLRTIARKGEPSDDRRTLSYLRYMGIIATAYEDAPADRRRAVDTIRAVADKFASDVRQLDASFAARVSQSDALAVSPEYGQQKSALASTAVARLRAALPAREMGRIEFAINEKVKRSVTIIK